MQRLFKILEHLENHWSTHPACPANSPNQSPKSHATSLSMPINVLCTDCVLWSMEYLARSGHRSMWSGSTMYTIRLHEYCKQIWLCFLFLKERWMPGIHDELQEAIASVRSEVFTLGLKPLLETKIVPQGYSVRIYAHIAYVYSSRIYLMQRRFE